MELVSVVVPVYQVRNYLKECVDSLCAQTFKNLEILLMDDGSDDGSEKLCDELQRRDYRIRTCHLEHRGLSAARNAGIEAARGEWIAFVDSDDWVAPDFIEVLYRIAVQYKAPIAVCNYVRIGNGRDFGKRAERTLDVGEMCLSSDEMLSQWHGKRKRIETVVWNKLYRRILLTGEKDYALFPEGTIHEDVYVSHLLVHRAQRVAITEEKLYFYRKAPDSLTRKKYTDEKVRQSIAAQTARADFFRRAGYMAAYERLGEGLLLHIIKYRWTFSVKNKRLKQELGALFGSYYPIVKNSGQASAWKMALITIYAFIMNSYHEEV